MASFRNPQDPLNFKCFGFLNRESFVDVTLIADGRFMQAHKIVLAASSGYFEEIFQMIPDKNPAIVLKDVSYLHLQQMMQYIYCGSVTIPIEEVKEFKKVLESLKIVFEQDSKVKKTIDPSKEESKTETATSTEEDFEDMIDFDEPNWTNMIVKDEPKSDDESSGSISNLEARDEPNNSPNIASTFASIIQKPTPRFARIAHASEGKISVERVVPSKKIQRLMIQHPLTCPFCEKLFKTSKHRNEHVKYCFQNPDRIVSICPLCNKNVCDPYYLRKHLKNVHGKDSTYF